VAHRKKKIPAQLVEDEAYQLRHERVAGIDIAKGKGDVSVRLPPAEGRARRQSRVQPDVQARARDILDLGAQLLADGVEVVVMESTSDYWRIWYYLLESLGLCVALVNASHARQLAGRPKTDRLDCQWLARLAEMGLLRPSFVPPPEIRALRDLTRARQQLVRDRSRVWQRLEKLLEGALVKLSSELSSLARVKTARLILDALAGGERDPKALSALALGSLAGRRGDLEAALEGMTAGPHHSRLIRVHLDHVALLDRSVAGLEADIAAALEDVPAAWGVNADGEPSPAPGPGARLLPADARLAEIPGVSPDLARAIIAETGLDMSVFPAAAHLASWAGLAPVARQSGPRSRKPTKGQGNAYLKNLCTQAANGAAKTSSFLGERHGRLARRIGPNKAKCAVARSILVIVWHLLSDPEARYTDLGPDWHARKTGRDKKIRSHIRQLQALGVDTSTLNAAHPAA
jgi:transposase